MYHKHKIHDYYYVITWFWASNLIFNTIKAGKLKPENTFIIFTWSSVKLDHQRPWLLAIAGTVLKVQIFVTSWDFKQDNKHQAETLKTEAAAF